MSSVTSADPVDILGDVRGDLVQRNGKLCQLGLAVRPDIKLSLGEQHFRLEDKSVANDPHIFTPTKNIAKLTEFGPEALQFLHPDASALFSDLPRLAMAILSRAICASFSASNPVNSSMERSAVTALVISPSAREAAFSASSSLIRASRSHCGRWHPPACPPSASAAIRSSSSFDRGQFRLRGGECRLGNLQRGHPVSQACLCGGQCLFIFGLQSLQTPDFHLADAKRRGGLGKLGGNLVALVAALQQLCCQRVALRWRWQAAS